jgi:hypothetical protein
MTILIVLCAFSIYGLNYYNDYKNKNEWNMEYKNSNPPSCEISSNYIEGNKLVHSYFIMDSDFFSGDKQNVNRYSLFTIDYIKIDSNIIKTNKCTLLINGEEKDFEASWDGDLQCYQITDNLENGNDVVLKLMKTDGEPIHIKFKANDSFSEKNKKVYFLKTSTIITDMNMKKLIEKREEALIKNDVAKYFLHYHNQVINIRDNFRTLLLKETWGDINVFNIFVEGEVAKYLQEQAYCPFSVCIALRKKIEEKIYLQLDTDDLKNQFIEKHGTPNKLDFAEINGIIIPEIYYLLGVVYNEVAHLKNYVQNNSPLINKLENMTIKSMIKKVFE